MLTIYCTIFKLLWRWSSAPSWMRSHWMRWTKPTMWTSWSPRWRTSWGWSISIWSFRIWVFWVWSFRIWTDKRWWAKIWWGTLWYTSWYRRCSLKWNRYHDLLGYSHIFTLIFQINDDFLATSIDIHYCTKLLHSLFCLQYSFLPNIQWKFN